MVTVAGLSDRWVDESTFDEVALDGERRALVEWVGVAELDEVAKREPEEGPVIER